MSFALYQGQQTKDSQPLPSATDGLLYGPQAENSSIYLFEDFPSSFFFKKDQNDTFTMT